MNLDRVFHSNNFFQPTDSEPIRAVVTASADAVVVAWYLYPEQEISAHIHPSGQDTWTILAGEGEYYLDSLGKTQTIVAGDVVVAPSGSVHGVINRGKEVLMFISIVTPASAGYERSK